MNHMYTPPCPLSDAIAVVSASLPSSAAEALRRQVREVLLLPAAPALPPPVSSHPDMLMFALGNTLITYRDYYPLAKPVLDALCRHTGMELQLTDHPRQAVYPRDVGLNALVIPRSTGGFVFARPASLAPEIPLLAAAAGYRLLPVKQGYAGCSGLAVNGCLVTGDPSLRRAALTAGIPVITVDHSTIRLPGYDHGFIGGAGGVWGQTILLCGTPDERMLAVLRPCANVICLGDMPLRDCGGIRLFPSPRQS